jgi:peptidyl-tRNA hydrolase, PTH1 family
MRLIVGLGNPGPEYIWTPHNLGFLAVDKLAERAGIRVSRPEARSLIGRGRLADQEVVLAKPQTMMNGSGLAVRALMDRLEIGPSELIVIYDEVALPWGVLRIRPRGTAGGHNGMKSVIGALGTGDFVRVRLGVRPEHPPEDLVDYLLRPMSHKELEQAAEMMEQAADATEMILAQGVQPAMNRFNRRVPPPEQTPAA